MNDGMKKLLIVIVLLAAIGAVIAAKQLKSTMEPKPDGDVKIAKNIDDPPSNETGPESKVPEVAIEDDPDKAAAIAITEKALADKKLPRLLELGSVSCIPCKKMKPILDELEVEYDGLMNVEFIDVWKDTSAGKKYEIDLIPTQIFFDADGKELFRHEGFFSKESIMAKWKEFGIEFSEAK